MVGADAKGLVIVLYEFVISIVVLVGGGVLLSKGIAQDIDIAAITSVLTFWFARSGTLISNGNQQLQGLLSGLLNQTSAQAPQTVPQPVAQQPAPAAAQTLIADPAQTNASTGK